MWGQWFLNSWISGNGTLYCALLSGNWHWELGFWCVLFITFSWFCSLSDIHWIDRDSSCCLVILVLGGNSIFPFQHLVNALCQIFEAIKFLHVSRRFLVWEGIEFSTFSSWYSTSQCHIRWRDWVFVLLFRAFWFGRELVLQSDL